MVRDFILFLLALWNEWKALLTGGTLIAAEAIASIARKKPMPSSVNWLILGVTLIIAAFLAWRKEWIQNGEGFVNVTPLQLVTLIEDVTGVLADSRLAPYRNKWIRVTGTLMDVSPSAFPWMYVRVQYGAGYGVSVIFNMNRWKASRLIPVPKGTTVTVAGRIKRVGGTQLDLTDAELINLAVPQSSTHDPSSPPASPE
jgi:hypothetical protein